MGHPGHPEAAGHPLRPQTFKKAPENVVTGGGGGDQEVPAALGGSIKLKSTFLPLW